MEMNSEDKKVFTTLEVLKNVSDELERASELLHQSMDADGPEEALAKEIDADIPRVEIIKAFLMGLFDKLGAVAKAVEYLNSIDYEIQEETSDEDYY